MPRVGIDPFHSCVKAEFHASLTGKIHQSINDAIHATFWIPDAMREFRVGHHRERGGCFKWAQPCVNILKGEGALQPRILEIGRHVAIMADEWLETKE